MSTDQQRTSISTTRYEGPGRPLECTFLVDDGVACEQPAKWVDRRLYDGRCREMGPDWSGAAWCGEHRPERSLGRYTPPDSGRASPPPGPQGDQQ